MNEAIKLAIKGGYANDYYPTDLTETQFNKRIDSEIKEVILLDPLFWQSLDKALDWNDDWFNEALRYFSVVLNEEDKEAYWSNLLATAKQSLT